MTEDKGKRLRNKYVRLKNINMFGRKTYIL
jgi:hypothetical protein